MPPIFKSCLFFSLDLDRVFVRGFAAAVVWLAVGIVSLMCPSSLVLAQQSPAIETQAKTPAAEQPEEPAAAVQDELVKKLAEAISDTVWTGSFTMKGDTENLKNESYEITEAEYQGNDQWVLTARIAYGGRDVTVPIPLEIKWAGRTPVITVDNLTIPSLGTFDARVLMRKGSYAGTWAHGDKGGHLFGKYQKKQDGDDDRRSEVSRVF